MSEELKPCPFCEGEGVIYEYSTVETCPCSIRPVQPAEAEVVSRGHIMDALLMWNRRHEKPPIAVGYEYGVAEAVLDMVAPTLSAVITERDALAAARMAYANEFAQDEHGDPDVGSVHANIRALKAERDRLDAECGRLLEGKIQDAETIYVLEAELEQLRAEVGVLRKDAERYRAFRKAGLPNGLGVYDAELDAACDELIEEQREGA